MTDGMPAKKSSIKKKLVFGVGLFMLVSATCVAIVTYFRSQNPGYVEQQQFTPSNRDYTYEVKQTSELDTITDPLARYEQYINSAKLSQYNGNVDSALQYYYSASQIAGVADELKEDNNLAGYYLAKANDKKDYISKFETLLGGAENLKNFEPKDTIDETL